MDGHLIRLEEHDSQSPKLRSAQFDCLAAKTDVKVCAEESLLASDHQVSEGFRARGMNSFATVHIRGNFLFRRKMKKAIAILPVQFGRSFNLMFPVKHIISSERLKLDLELGVLYLNHKLKPPQIAEVLQNIITRGQISLEHSLQYGGGLIGSGKMGSLNNRLFRVSAEKRVDSGIRDILEKPPRGKVATESQHFLMKIMQLLIFVKKIIVNIENNSDIALLVKERKSLQKTLNKVRKDSLDSSKIKNLSTLKTAINELDQSILRKRIILQRRFINRAISVANNWQGQENYRFQEQEYLEKKNKIKNQLDATIEKKRKLKNKPGHILNRLRSVYYEKQATSLRREMIKLKYLLERCYNRKEHAAKISSYLLDNYYDVLIPTGYVKSFKVVCFDFLRFTINIAYIAFYIYLIKIPLLIIPVFSGLGLIVFQPIANKFAVLFMSLFIKNQGLKRLTAAELKKVIADKISKNNIPQYCCAIDLPIFSGTIDELDTTAHYIKKSTDNLYNTLNYYDKLGILFQVTSNTGDEVIVDKEVEMIKGLQKEIDGKYGPGKIYLIYLHRKSCVAKKVGNIIAAHLFKHHGVTSSDIYLDSDKFMLWMDEGPLFDRIYGNIASSLCVKKTNAFPEQYNNKKLTAMVLRGERIPVDGSIEFSFFVDNKNEIKTAGLENALATLLHSENDNVVILQPQISIEDPVSEGQKVTSIFLRLLRIARGVHNNKYLNVLHSIYHNMSAYYGKGMVRIKNYDYMVTNEVLNLKYVDSHDWQESVFNNTVFSADGDNKVVIDHINEDTANVIIENKEEINIYKFNFKGSKCVVIDEDGNKRELNLITGSREEKVRQVLSYLESRVEVSERELITTIGNYTRELRWLKGDLQMLNTFLSYAMFIPPYHRYHLENICRRLTSELALFAWVFVTFFVLAVLPTGIQLGQEALYLLTLYFAVTAFGFSGIDLFVFPVIYEVERSLRVKSKSFYNFQEPSAKRVFGTFLQGLWQFPLYLLIAWPRNMLGISSSVRILLAGIDQSVNWGGQSNAAISSEEINGKGMPLAKFINFYRGSFIAGSVLLVALIALSANGIVFSSALLPLNMGLIITSLLLGPLVSYVISRKIITS